MKGHKLIEDIHEQYVALLNAPAASIKAEYQNRFERFKSYALKTIKELMEAQYFNFGKLDTRATFKTEDMTFFADWMGDVRLTFDKCVFEFEIPYEDLNTYTDISILVSKAPMDDKTERPDIQVENPDNVFIIQGFVCIPENKEYRPQHFCALVAPTTQKIDTPADGQQIFKNGEDHVLLLQSPLVPQEFDPVEQAWLNQHKGEITTVLEYINIALLLLSTKNIVTKRHDPPDKLNKKRKKRDRIPLFSYHTLHVKLPSERSAGPPGEKSGAIMPVHLCRGHFKHYTPEAPLFGRYTGRYWWQPHARGSKKAGIVVKDYEVNT